MTTPTEKNHNKHLDLLHDYKIHLIKYVTELEKMDKQSEFLKKWNETTIKEIALLVKKKIGYQGNIIWDASKPSGPPRRFVDINKAKKEFGYCVTTTLEEGINKTIDWYMSKF